MSKINSETIVVGEIRKFDFVPTEGTRAFLVTAANADNVSVEFGELKKLKFVGNGQTEKFTFNFIDLNSQTVKGAFRQMAKKQDAAPLDAHAGTTETTATDVAVKTETPKKAAKKTATVKTEAVKTEAVKTAAKKTSKKNEGKAFNEKAAATGLTDATEPAEEGKPLVEVLETTDAPAIELNEPVVELDPVAVAEANAAFGHLPAEEVIKPEEEPIEPIVAPVADEPTSQVQTPAPTSILDAVIENSQTALVKAQSQTPSSKGDLTEVEQELLDGLEQVIEERREQFDTLTLEIGAAVYEIERLRLWRGLFKNMPAYVKHRWGYGRSQAYNLVAAGKLYEALTLGKENPLQELPSLRTALKVDKTVRELTKGMPQNEIEGFERRVTKFVYNFAIATAPKNAEGEVEREILPRHFTHAFETLEAAAKTGTVMLNGEQIPFSIAAVALDQEVTQSTHESTQRMKDGLIQEVQTRRERLNEPRRRESLPTADADAVENALNGAFGEDEKAVEGEIVSETKIDPNATPVLSLDCSAHADATFGAFVHGGIEMSCGCVWYDVTGKGLTYGGNQKVKSGK